MLPAAVCNASASTVRSFRSSIQSSSSRCVRFAVIVVDDPATLATGHRVTGSGRPPPVPTERGVQFLLRCTFGVPHHALRQVVHSTFAAVRSKSVSMVSLILSLHRGLSLPLHGAHVAPE